MKTIYISGPMTGLPCFNFMEFFYWEKVWTDRGWTVVNPARVDCEKMLRGWVYTEEQYREILDEDLRLIREECDAIFMMNGWVGSDGANEEYAEAVNYNKEILFEVGDGQPFG